MRIRHCKLYETSLISRYLPRTPIHIHAKFEFTITPKQAIVWSNGLKWITFKKDQKGQYWSPIHGYLEEEESVGVAWGRPIVLGARRSILELPNDEREQIKGLLSPVRMLHITSRV